MRSKPSSRNKWSIILPVLIALVALAVLLSVGGFVYAANQESRDAFCGSCHTQPESTFLARSTSAQPVDLASFHTTKTTRCIDCHSGAGVFGRVQAELLGAKNAVKWYSGSATQPAPLTVPIVDGNCLKCHQQVTQRGGGGQGSTPSFNQGGEGEGEGRNNHWHEFLARWQSADRNAGGCVSCHPGHSTDVSTTNFQNQQTTQQVCDACHAVLRERE